jgi:hypothetical protein
MNYCLSIRIMLALLKAFTVFYRFGGQYIGPFLIPLINSLSIPTPMVWIHRTGVIQNTTQYKIFIHSQNHDEESEFRHNLRSKEECKRLFINKFVRDVDYVVIAPQIGGAKKGGHNKQNVMMTINATRKLILRKQNRFTTRKNCNGIHKRTTQRKRPCL